MLLLMTFVFIVTINLSATLDPLLLQFLTELVIKVLQWRWVVLVEERHGEINSSLVEFFLQRNISVTVLTSRVESSIRHLLKLYNTVPALLLYSPKVKKRPFLFDTCKIKWIMIMPDYSPETLLRESTEYIDRLHIVFVVRRSNDVFALQVPTENTSDILQINSWHPQRGFENLSTFRTCSAKPIRHLRIAMEKHFPFYQLGNSTHPDKGGDINIMDSLAMSLKFTYEVKRPPDGSWGNRNGTEWNGMIGMLLRNEADAALSGMTMSYDRQREVPFSIPYAFDRINFVARKPAPRLKTWAIFWPYTIDVWIALATSIVLIASLLTWLQTRLRRRRQHRLRLVDSLTYIFQSILNQGYYNAREPRCRVLMAFWWGFCITVIAGYNGSLMSFMAHPGLSPALDTIVQLIEAVKKGEIDVGTIENSADYAVFKNSDEPGLQAILKNMNSDPQNLVHHDVEGLREALRRSYAYVGGWVTVQADVWDTSLFLFSRDAFLQYGYAIAFVPGFDYIDVFNRKILQLREAGFIQKWLLEIIQQNQHRGNVDEDSTDQDDDDADEASQSALSIDDVQGAFVVLTIGLLLSVICCIFENYIAWKRRKKGAKFRRWQKPTRRKLQ